MARRFQNYRKAAKGETRCAECALSQPPAYHGARRRCGTGWLSQAVGSQMTCDAATKEG